MKMRLRSAVLYLALAAGFVLAVAGGSREAEAGHPGLAFPAPAGSDWSIVAGYNTATHFGEDPYAVDLVRVDAPTAGTAVLAPLAGIIAFVSNSCLTIADGHGQEVLLCHFFPGAGLARGQPVARGEWLGFVAAGGLAENNGLAHIHLAVHRSLGAGLIQESVPLAGAYAIEGQDLPATDAPYAFANQPFRSTNVLGGAANDAGATEDMVEDPGATGDTNVVVSEPRALLPGWNLVGWGAPSAIAAAVAPIADQVGVVFAFDRGSQTFRRYSPGASAAANTLTELAAGDALLVFVTTPTGVTWLAPPVDASTASALVAGFNLVTWAGSSRPVGEALASLGDALVAAFALDASTQQYRVYRPDGPALANNLTMLEQGQGVWLQLRAPANAILPEPPTETPLGSRRVLGPGCLNLRSAPTTAVGPPLTCLAVGTAVELLGEGAQDGEGRDWLRVSVAGFRGWVASEFLVAIDLGSRISGEATFYAPSLAGNPMYCSGTYDPANPTIAATTSWPCGTQLRVWRGERFVDVVVQDTGLLPANHVDLSEAAFQRLGTLAEGRLTVLIEVVG